MTSLPAIADDQLAREIDTLRAQVADLSPPRTMLESCQRERLMLKLWQLQDEQRRRAVGPERKRRRGRKPRPAYTHWTTTAERRPTVEDKANREADRRLAHVLGSA